MASKLKTRKKQSPQTDRKKKVMFRMEAPEESRVFIAGSFNDWDPSARRLRHTGNSSFAGSLMLGPGRYEYKFIVDGEWLPDPKNEQWIVNDQGSLNSVLEVPRPQ